MTSSDVARWALLALLSAPSTALAGACCAGSTTTIPTRLGECEKVLAGVGVAATTSAGRWDHDGATKASSLTEQSVVTTLAAGYRWNRKAQIGLSAPVWVNHKIAGDTSAWGGGPGDLRITGTWDPLEESMGDSDSFGMPVPVVWVGARLPTGRSAEQAHGAMFEDVTGLGPPALTLGADVERSLGMWPWSLGVDGELGIDADGLRPIVTGFAGFGRYFGTKWSLIGSARHTRTWAEGTPTARTAAGARVVYGQRLRYRAWAGVEADVPAPMLGQSAMRQVSVGAGAAWVR